MAQKKIPFDFDDPTEIKIQLQNELNKINKTSRSFCDFCGLDEFHFYNKKMKEPKAIITIRKLMAFVKKLNPEFTINWKNETHIITQILNECANHGYKKVKDICRELKMPARSLYVNSAETKAINSLRKAVEFFNMDNQ
jgi:hypothetical protein